MESPGSGLSELASQLETYNPTIPDSVISHYISSAGVQPQDPRLLRIIAIAAQKFLADIANDALQHCKTRSTGVGGSGGSGTGVGGQQPNKGHNKAKDKKYTMTMEDLIPALHDYGISARKPNYFV